VYRLYGGDFVRVKQTQRGAAVTLDAGTSGNTWARHANFSLPSALRGTKVNHHNSECLKQIDLVTQFFPYCVTNNEKSISRSKRVTQRVWF